MPDLGDKLPAIAAKLNDRFARVPFGRVRRWADYWALCRIEREHIGHLAEFYGLAEDQHEALRAHWIGRIDAELSETLVLLRTPQAVRPPHVIRRLHWNWLFQLWFNTLGPGARTWFGNRYARIRPFTFRVYWRP